MRKGKKAKELQTSSKNKTKKIYNRKLRRITKEPENQKLNLRLLEDVKNLSKKHNSVYGSIWINRPVPSISLHGSPPIKVDKKKKRISKNTAYKRGRQFEYRVKKHFEKLGYYVKRSYASKGFEDLIAIKKIQLVSDGNSIGNGLILSEVLLLQCKNLKSEKPLSKREIMGLKQLADITGATPLYAYNDKNHKIQIKEI